MWLLMVAQGNSVRLSIFGCVSERSGGRDCSDGSGRMMVGGGVQSDTAQGLHLFLCMAGPMCACVCESVCAV